MKTTAIITAGGTGKRMGRPKQFLELLGKPIIEWTISVFKACKLINDIILVVTEDDMKQSEKYNLKLAIGGKERVDSVKNGLKLVESDTDLVLIHDGARPLITSDIIETSIRTAMNNDAVIVGVPVKDTIKEVDNDSLDVIRTLDRKLLWHIQTPQIFKYSLIKTAYENMKGFVTDDAKLVEDLGINVKVIMGSYENIKITTPEDLLVAETLLKNRIKTSKN